MAIAINLDEKGFDYLNALTDVGKMIEKQLARGKSADDTLDILEQLGDAAARRFNEMLEELHQQYHGTSREEVGDSASPHCKYGRHDCSGFRPS